MLSFFFFSQKLKLYELSSNLLCILFPQVIKCITSTRPLSTISSDDSDNFKSSFDCMAKWSVTFNFDRHSSSILCSILSFTVFALIIIWRSTRNDDTFYFVAVASFFIHFFFESFFFFLLDDGSWSWTANVDVEKTNKQNKKKHTTSAECGWLGFRNYIYIFVVNTPYSYTSKAKERAHNGN